MKTRYDNDVIDRIGVISVKYDAELLNRSNSIWSMRKMRQDKNVIDCLSSLYIENETKM